MNYCAHVLHVNLNAFYRRYSFVTNFCNIKNIVVKVCNNAFFFVNRILNFGMSCHKVVAYIY